MTPAGLVCAWCGRERTPRGDWTVNASGEPQQSLATHGICPDCLARETQAALASGRVMTLQVDQRR